MDPKATLQELLEELKNDGVRVVVKEGFFWRALHWIVFAVTFGGNRTFLTDYYTTIGPWVGVPKGWERYRTEGRIATLHHEYVHVKQARRLGLGSAIAGLPLFFLLYVLLPLPIGLAYFRYRFERVAYVVGINVKIDFRPTDRAHEIDNAVVQMTSGKYGWTWPFKKSVRAYFEANVAPARMAVVPTPEQIEKTRNRVID